MAAMILLLLVSTLLTWRVGNEIRRSIDSQVRVITTAQRLEHYGDVLLMSIKSVVAHGDVDSAAEYRNTQPKLRSTMVDLRTQVQSATNGLEVARVDRADLALVGMEYEALPLLLAVTP